MMYMVDNYENRVLELYDSLLGFAISMLRDEEKAKDLTQEVMYIAFKNRHIYKEEGGNLRSWLSTIMRNEFINQYRKEVKKPFIIEYNDELYKSNKQNQPNNSLHIEQIQSEIQNLPQDCKRVLELWMKGLHYWEISLAVLKPEGTVKSLLHRGRKILKESEVML